MWNNINTKIITTAQIIKRLYWIDKISRLSGNFGDDAQKVEEEISKEIVNEGADVLLGHLRLCGAIPESYGHDTTEEKLYSKYTDIVIHESFLAMGFVSNVLKERADVADVECVANDFSFVADAKAFRLSRTAKNQKDFKVQAMDRWKHGKPYAIVVCPVYQLPATKSQIYQQAGAQSVCVGTYSHLTVIVRYALATSQQNAIALMHEIFLTVEAMNPSKSAIDYWQTLNRRMLSFDGLIREIWQEEKEASIEAIQISRNIALTYLSTQRERIMRMSKEEAVAEILKSMNLDNRIRVIQAISDNGILGFS
ncbi:MAG TPA: HindIII family type II restriction endonuclease [Pyrinomonadaceae bacterium]|nr:HindIII family type II restriction endonuclease [Pyrinomonadaceae bacterium]